MSFIPTEKIHLSKKQVSFENLEENNNNHSNLSANFNRNYSSPFKKIPNSVFSFGFIDGLIIFRLGE